MDASRQCPKCEGGMASGLLKEVGNYGNPRTVFAPADEPAFAVRGAQSQRRDITAQRCERCGYLELYAL